MGRYMGERERLAEKWLEERGRVSLEWTLDQLRMRRMAERRRADAEKGKQAAHP